ncbi:NLR family CARD domain-containing protein 3 [Osmerus mordax]|uniref:NLR family CARD domain-containing protein 3 n=1 Tax=Osmerus mordax TaxID=8014 RepID=UPI003510A611
MDSDTEVKRILSVRKDDGHDRPEAPPSSYGSMKSDEEEEEDITETTESLARPEIPESIFGTTLLQLNRSDSPETLHTEFTQQQSLSARKHGAYITDSKSEDGLEEVEEGADEEDWDGCPPDSPEPPPIEEPEDQSVSDEQSEHSLLGQLHPELDLPYIFKAIQKALSQLTDAEMYQYKRSLCWRDQPFTLEQLEECDTLDVVDKIIEAYGRGEGLEIAIQTMHDIRKPELAEELTKTCKRALVQLSVKVVLKRKHGVIHEGIPKAGQQVNLRKVYTEPQISCCGHGGISPFHEFPGMPPPPVPQVACPDTFVRGNDIFRTPPGSGAVRTVLTTGIPGIGLTVAVQKFIMDWCNELANRDIQFIFKINFRELRVKKNHHMKPGQTVSFTDMLTYYYHDLNNTNLLAQPDFKALFILEGMDLYQSPLDFKATPVVSDITESVSLDSLLVNLIRGSLMPSSLVWVTGRRAATSQIPTEYLHKVYEIQGYSNELKEEFLTKRYTDKELAAQIISHLKLLPSLYDLCQMPFMCWMVSMIFERGFQNEDDYGDKPPKLTPFYVHHVIVQTNRRLEKYYDAPQNHQTWQETDREFLKKVGKMAFKLLEKGRPVFHEEDMKDYSLTLEEVAVYSGIVTELPPESNKRRTFSFIHYTFQEFMAALYVFMNFRAEGKNVLDQSRIISRLVKDRSMVDLLRSAIDRTLSAPFGRYEIFLRFLCGMAQRINSKDVLRGVFFEHDTPLVKGLEEAARLLQKRMESAEPERQANLEECFRELTQSDD